MTDSKEIRGALCSMCEMKPFKYTCPGCERKTCSLECIQYHKSIYSCSGVREKTTFIPIKEFTMGNLMQDYTFLQDVLRVVDNASRENMEIHSQLRQSDRIGNALHLKSDTLAPVAVTGHLVSDEEERVDKQETEMGNRKNAAQQQALIAAAKHRHIHLECMSPGIRRHDINNTFLLRRQVSFVSSHSRLKMILWTVEFKFIRIPNLHPPQSSLTLDSVEHKVKEIQTLSDILQTLFSLAYSHRPQHKAAAFLQQLNVECGLFSVEDCVVFMKRERISSKKPIYYKVSLDQCLKNVLKNKIIVEFPTFYVLSQRYISGDSIRPDTMALQHPLLQLKPSIESNEHLVIQEDVYESDPITTDKEQETSVTSIETSATSIETSVSDAQVSEKPLVTENAEKAENHVSTTNETPLVHIEKQVLESAILSDLSVIAQ